MTRNEDALFGEIEQERWMFRGQVVKPNGDRGARPLCVPYPDQPSPSH
jgi:hypothetical protein